MFSNSLTFVTALTMLAHSVWGCCWHHVHGDVCANPVVCSHAGSVDHDHGACLHNRSHSDAHGESTDLASHSHDSPDEDGHQHGPCKDIRCTFVKTASTGIDGFFVSYSAVMPAIDAPVLISLVSYHREAENQAPPLLAHSARAMTQSWLL